MPSLLNASPPKAIAQADHGFAADESTLKQRMVDWRSSFQIDSPQREWWYSQYIVGTVRIDRSQRDEVAMIRCIAERAVTCWDLDRRAEAEIIAEGLNRNPPRVLRKLRQTRQGAEWLLARWKALAELAKKKAWTDDHYKLASDLLGTPPLFRDPNLKVNLTDPHAIAEREIERLNRLISQVLEERDAFEQKATVEGLDVLASPWLRGLVQREMALKRWFRLAWKELRDTKKKATTSSSTPVAVNESYKNPEPEPADQECGDPCEPYDDDMIREMRESLSDSIPSPNLRQPEPTATPRKSEFVGNRRARKSAAKRARQNASD